MFNFIKRWSHRRERIIDERIVLTMMVQKAPSLKHAIHAAVWHANNDSIYDEIDDKDYYMTDIMTKLWKRHRSLGN